MKKKPSSNGPVKIPIECAACGKKLMVNPTKTGKPRPPKGWKSRGDCYYDLVCWKKLYRLSAVILPVAGPLEGGTVKKLWDELRIMWNQCRQLANWLTTELAKRDTPRTPEQEKMAKMPSVYLYNEACAMFPNLPCSTVASHLRAVEAKYRERRFDVLWTFEMSLPSQRKSPFPVSNQAWTASFQSVTDDNGRTYNAPCVSVPINDHRWLLRLRGGPNFHRQSEAFEKIISGEAVQGELALYYVRASEGSHRHTHSKSGSGGGNKTRWRLMCKVVCWFPRENRDKRNRRGTLEVRTARNALWVAVAPGREKPWLMHADWLRGLFVAHSQKLQRLSDDTKAERRRPARRKKGFQDYLDKVCHRYACRKKSGIEYVAAQLVGFAARQGLKTLRYDDSDTSYLPAFPWQELRERVMKTCDNMEVEFVHVTPPPPAETPAETPPPPSDGDPEPDCVIEE